MPNTNYNAEAIIADYKNHTLSLAAIADKHKVCQSTIYKIVRKNNLVNNPERRRHALKAWEKIPVTEYETIAILYESGLTSEEIGQKYNVCLSSICGILKKIGIDRRHRIYDIRANYFSNIDTNRKAYLLGYLLADGHNNTEKYQITFQLKETDRYAVELLRSEIYPNNDKPFIFREETDFEFKGKLCHRSRSISIEIQCKQISLDLEKLGMVRDKTDNMFFPPDLENQYYASLLRGYLDGDGFIDKDVHLCGYCCNPSAVPILQELITKYTGCHTKIRQHSSSERNLYVMIEQKENAKRFLDWLYLDAEDCLTRKKNIYDDRYKQDTKQ